MVSISVRPERYSYGLIKDSGEFVINLPTESLTRAVDWCGVKSGRNADKFAAMRLTAAPAAKVGTVLLEQSPVNLECKVTQRIPAGQPRPVFGPGGGRGRGRKPAGRERQALLKPRQADRLLSRGLPGAGPPAGQVRLQRAEETAAVRRAAP